MSSVAGGTLIGKSGLHSEIDYVLFLSPGNEFALRVTSMFTIQLQQAFQAFCQS